MGETLHGFVRRLRLERAVTRPDEEVTDIALDAGFSGSAAFARAFKSRFGVSASEWRESGRDRIYHDNPEITDEGKLRVSVCVVVPPETEVSGEIGKMAVAGGPYAVGRFELSSDEFAGAWNTLYGVWLPESGYEPDDRPAFEIYRNDPRQHPQGKSIVDICVPVKPTSS